MAYSANIGDALKLVIAGTQTKTNYTYFFAASVPSYWVGVTSSNLSTSQSAFTPFVMSNSSFAAPPTGTDVAFLRATNLVEAITNVELSQGGGAGANIIIGGVSPQLFADSNLAIPAFDGVAADAFASFPAPTGTAPGSPQAKVASDIWITPRRQPHSTRSKGFCFTNLTMLWV